MFDLFDCAGRLGTSILRTFPAEPAHTLGGYLLKSGCLSLLPDPQFEGHGVDMQTLVPGIGNLPHPIGLAAGFDKDAKLMKPLLKLGFSFLEVGTVTPKPQSGNPKPRLFRDPGQRAIVNRMGFNNLGAILVAKNIRASNWTHSHPPLGINLGKNKDTPDSKVIDDYIKGLETFQDLGRYFVVNISSPNTPGLRTLARPEFIKALSLECSRFREQIWIKLDPDMPKRTFQENIASICENGFRGVILANTHRVEYPQHGGQSGHPLLSFSNIVLDWAWEVHQGKLPTIATGGVLSGADAYYKLSRGACALQLYTALVYRGPGAVARIFEELALELKLRGFKQLKDAIGVGYKE